MTRMGADIKGMGVSSILPTTRETPALLNLVRLNWTRSSDMQRSWCADIPPHLIELLAGHGTGVFRIEETNRRRPSVRQFGFGESDLSGHRMDGDALDRGARAEGRMG